VSLDRARLDARKRPVGQRKAPGRANNDNWRGAFAVLVRTRGRGESASRGAGWLRAAVVDRDISGEMAVA
jgi:hypothetical protein